MKAFISYSLNDRDQYILTLLSSELRKKGFSLNQSNDFNREMSSLTKINIKKSQLFIGLITGKGTGKKRVIKEWNLANISNIPSIFLIENTVSVNPDFKYPYIKFDRYNPEEAIAELNRRTNSMKKKSNQDSNAWAWILGGAALLAVIGSLSNND